MKGAGKSGRPYMRYAEMEKFTTLGWESVKYRDDEELRNAAISMQSPRNWQNIAFNWIYHISPWHSHFCVTDRSYSLFYTTVSLFPSA
jgi:hypothetical protein